MNNNYYIIYKKLLIVKYIVLWMKCYSLILKKELIKIINILLIIMISFIDLFNPNLIKLNKNVLL